MLILAAVPIGRAEDASARLVAELARATLIAAEDTRRLRWLASSLNIELKARVVSYYDAVEARRTAELLGELEAGQDILLVTDAGTPGISDPGYRLVTAAAAAVPGSAPDRGEVAGRVHRPGMRCRVGERLHRHQPHPERRQVIAGQRPQHRAQRPRPGMAHRGGGRQHAQPLVRAQPLQPRPRCPSSQPAC